jgi:hypothetical protein
VVAPGEPEEPLLLIVAAMAEVVRGKAHAGMDQCVNVEATEN